MRYRSRCESLGLDFKDRGWNSKKQQMLPKVSKSFKSSLGLHRESAAIGQAEANQRVGRNPTLQEIFLQAEEWSLHCTALLPEGSL